MIAERLKGALRRIAPRAFQALRLHTRRRRVLRRLLAGQEPVVRAGPFAGMRFVSLGTSSGELPMVVGSFEAELHDVLERFIALDPPVVVNVGCAEGYYAVGLARRLPRAVVYAFDTDPNALLLCARVAALNGVAARVHLDDHADLRTLELDRALLVSDCEGCEYALLDPGRTPGLASCNVIVELHRSADPSQPERLLSAFRATHEVEILPFTPECPARTRILSTLESPEDRSLIAAERTMLDQSWAVLHARAATVPA